jgi:hypothetical protein
MIEAVNPITAAGRASSTRPGPIAPAAEAPGNRVAQAEPAAPPPAAEITTSVTRPPQSEPVMSTSRAAFPGPSGHCCRAAAAGRRLFVGETHWKSAESIGTLAAYNDHLARFPNCVFSTLAAARIEALKK